MSAVVEEVDSQTPVARLINDPLLAARRRTLPANSVINDAETPAEYCWLIQSGQVRLYVVAQDGSRRLVDILGPQNWFGSPALAGMATYGYRTETAVPTTLLVVSAKRMLEALPSHPRANQQIISEMAGRLRMVTEDGLCLAFEDCRHRLIRTLVRFSRSAAATPTHDGVALRLTHEQLAQAIGTARETVSLALTELRQANLLRTGRNQLLFNPDALSRAAWS